MDEEEEEGLRRMDERRSREIRWRVAVVGVDIFRRGDNVWRGRRRRVRILRFQVFGSLLCLL